jgi:hypothetical protein
MKRILTAVLLIATLCALPACRSPKGNYNRLQMGSSRPSPIGG